MRISFGPFAFDPQNRLLWREGAEIALPPRVLGVLEALIERPGEIVARPELLDRVWKDAFVTDTSLAEAVSVLRQALGDDPQAPTYIQTVHRRGYRFVAPLGSAGRDGSAEGQARAEADAERDHTRVGASSDPGLGPWAAWAIAIFTSALAASAISYGVRRNTVEPAAVTRFEVRPAAGSWFDRRAPAFAVAPDGRTIAWAACEGVSATCALFVRRIDRLEAVRLAGTDGAAAPFFSADGRCLAFFADGKLKKVAVSGGSPIVLADAPVPGGGSWNSEGEIVFSGLPAGGLAIAPDQGGEVTAITTPQPEKGELRHVWPSWMPGNRAILFTIQTSPVPGAPGLLALKPASSQTWRTLRGGVSRTVPAAPGYLLIASAADLQASTYDERMLTLTGASDTVLEALATPNGIPQFAAGGGTVVESRAPSAPGSIEWSDAQGRAIPNATRLAQLTLSPDGRRAAGVAADASGSDVWTVDLSSGALTRVTFGGTNVSPAWGTGGEVVYATRPADGPFVIASDAQMATGSHMFPAAVARDGRIATLQTLKDGRTALALISRGSSPEPLVPGRFDETSAAFSPDGTWIAYDADESGRREVYVQHVGSSRRTQVSTIGGERPSWSADSHAIYFQEGPRFVRISIDSGGSPRADSRTVIFDRPDTRVIGITPEGRLLVERQPPLDVAAVTVQWLQELRERLPLPVSSPR